jgi:hypothetical protein
MVRCENACDWCGKPDDYEVAFCDQLEDAYKRPADYAVFVMTLHGVPINVPSRWKNEPWSSTQFLEKSDPQLNYDAAFFCPRCLRDPEGPEKQISTIIREIVAARPEMRLLAPNV